MKRSITLLSSLLISACVSGYHPRYYFNQIEVANLTGGRITLVEARVVASKRSVNCEAVANNAICNDYFGRRLYPQQGIEVNWIDANGNRKSETLSPAVPATLSNSFPLQIIVEILSNGTVDVFYKQNEPNGNGGAIFIS